MRLSILFAIVMLYACQQRPVSSGENDNTSSVTDTSLNDKWILYAGLDTMPAREAFISFGPAENTFTGNSGCNHMSGTYSRNGNDIHFNERIILTKMACPGYNEQQFIHLLVTINNFRLSRDTLQLRKDSVAVFSFVR